MSPKRHPHKPSKNESFKRQSNRTLNLVLWELIFVSYDLIFQADFWELVMSSIFLKNFLMLHPNRQSVTRGFSQIWLQDKIETLDNNIRILLHVGEPLEPISQIWQISKEES